jgi:hypothetical protein
VGIYRVDSLIKPLIESRVHSYRLALIKSQVSKRFPPESFDARAGFKTLNTLERNFPVLVRGNTFARSYRFSARKTKIRRCAKPSNFTSTPTDGATG